MRSASSAVSGSSPGRPRDPGVDERVVAAAVELFGDIGWAGFTVEAVARRAGVGKASIYLRWPTKEALLDAALAARAVSFSDIDTGTLRGDLLQLVRQLLSVYLGASGRAMMRLSLDGRLIPGIRQRQEAFYRSQIQAARAVVRRGISRGELAEGTSVTLLLDTVCGGAMVHAMSTQDELRERVAAEAGAYAESLVGFLLGSSERS
ncbi:MAG TPA: TetR/AcrR family transcriptional regulator [Kineosporiaceae bacterium]